MDTLDCGYTAMVERFGGQAVNARAEHRMLLAWFLENYYHLEDNEVDDCICDDENDRGIDGIYIWDQINRIDVFQATLKKTSGKKLGDDLLKKLHGTLRQIETADDIRQLVRGLPENQLRAILEKNEIAKKVADGYEIKGVFLTNAESDPKATAYLKHADNIILYDETALKRDYRSTDKTPPIGTSISFNVSDVEVINHPMKQLQMSIAPIRATELVRMGGISTQELFSWNVRQSLKKTKVNKDIADSINKSGEHVYFPAFHNGITVLCEKLKSTDDRITISGYAVVNGCQSITGLFENKAKITDDLRILTKFIKVEPDGELAGKITHHTNNQNGISDRDLKSNDKLQIRLQREIGNSDKFRYRIKRGEEPTWEENKNLTVIDNAKAAQILLAFDVKQPWHSHQKFRLFDDSYKDIFNKPYVTGERIVILFQIFGLVQKSLEKSRYELFAKYSITPFFAMYLLRSVLEKDDLGKKFCENPEMFCKSPKKRARLLLCISEIMETIVRALDREYDRRTPRDDEQNKIGDFDYKNTLKTPKPSQEITEDVVEGYEGRCQYGDILPFSKLWDKRGRKKKKKVKK